MFELQPVLGAALPPDYQIFVSQHYMRLVDFLRSAEGKKAAQEFVESWHAALVEKPKELPAQITPL
jgi:hypothetical protein